MIVTVSGLHGTGKSTYAVRLAKSLKLRHVSAGVLFRRIAKERNVSLEEFGKTALDDPSIDRFIDDETMKEAEKGNVVIDGQLAGWVLKENSDLRIFLTAPDDVRLARIAKRTTCMRKRRNARQHKGKGFSLRDTRDIMD